MTIQSHEARDQQVIDEAHRVQTTAEKVLRASDPIAHELFQTGYRHGADEAREAVYAAAELAARRVHANAELDEDIRQTMTAAAKAPDVAKARERVLATAKASTYTGGMVDFHTGENLGSSPALMEKHPWLERTPEDRPRSARCATGLIFEADEFTDDQRKSLANPKYDDKAFVDALGRRGIRTSASAIHDHRVGDCKCHPSVTAELKAANAPTLTNPREITSRIQAKKVARNIRTRRTETTTRTRTLTI